MIVYEDTAYNHVRMHLALGKDVPLGRAIQRAGIIVAIQFCPDCSTITSGCDFREGQGAETVCDGGGPRVPLLLRKPTSGADDQKKCPFHAGLILGSTAEVGRALGHAKGGMAASG